MNLLLLDIALVLYVLAFFSCIVLKDKRKASLPFVGGTAVHLLALFFRWYESHKGGFGYPPLATMYESLSFLSLAIAFLYFFVFFKREEWRFLGLISSALSALVLFLPLALGMDRSLRPLVPALQSMWLPIHVTTCLIGYACFAISFVLGGLELLTDPKGSFIPPRRVLEELNYKAVAVGFVFLSAGIFTGAVWAHYAWGRYWSWDPKETWSLVTWLIYAGWLHMRLVRGWKGKRLAVLSVIGFLAVLFTYFGVNYLLSGLHSYV